MATAENLVDRRLASVGFTNTIVNLIAEVACQRLCRDALQNGADPRRRRRALHQESHRLRQQYKQKWQTQQRQQAAEKQHAAPPKRWDHLGGYHTPERRAQGEAAEHGGDHQRATALRAVFGGQGDRIGHGATQAKSGKKTHGGQAQDIL
ncbi:hypothetical protein D3C71_1767880 [compost metagenome]